MLTLTYNLREWFPAEEIELISRVEKLADKLTTLHLFNTTDIAKRTYTILPNPNSAQYPIMAKITEFVGNEVSKLTENIEGICRIVYLQYNDGKITINVIPVSEDGVKL